MVNNLSAFINEKISKHKEFGKELSWNVFYRCLLILANLISGMILSRDLGDANRGIFQLFNTSLGLFAISFNFGLNSSAYYYANKKADSIRSYLASNIVLSCFSAVIICYVIIAWISVSEFSFQFDKYDFYHLLFCLFSFCNLSEFYGWDWVQSLLAKN
jgi:O-antigen/teichoic acid export membrane protein